MEENTKEISGFFTCPICKGNYIKKEYNDKLGLIITICGFCLGKKLLDWTEIIIGVDESWFNVNFNSMDMKLKKHNIKKV